MSVCIMGCKLASGHRLHGFPQDVKRRAEWCRILGVYPRKNRVFLCSAHIPDYFVLGNKLSRYTIPNPPQSRKLVNNFSTSYDDIADKIKKEISDTSDDIQLRSDEKENKVEQNTQETQQNKIEDFEIRKGNNNDMIIKGRFIQTDNYLMVSYTPPKKWTLQKQVELLDGHCKEQLRQIQIINKQNYLLRTELNKYKMLLPKLRYLQMYNRSLYAQLKMYKIKEKAAKTRRLKKLKKHEDATTVDLSTPETH